jgi:hypothetical protein
MPLLDREDNGRQEAQARWIWIVRHGPPFGTTREEILDRFSPFFERLEDWVPRAGSC